MKIRSSEEYTVCTAPSKTGKYTPGVVVGKIGEGPPPPNPTTILRKFRLLRIWKPKSSFREYFMSGPQLSLANRQEKLTRQCHDPYSIVYSDMCKYVQ
jgi:hypothetical protein